MSAEVEIESKHIKELAVSLNVNPPLTFISIKEEVSNEDNSKLQLNSYKDEQNTQEKVIDPLFTPHDVKTEVEQSQQLNSIENQSVQSQFLNYDLVEFKCNQCAYTTKVKPNLMKHTLRCQSRLLECDRCSYTTKSKQRLRNHIVYHHENPEYFKCDYCNYVSKVRRHLKQHLLIHTSAELLECDQCDFTTKLKAYLSRHLLTHKISGSFKCDHCSYSTNYKRTFNRHMLKHKEGGGFKCDQCCYTTARKGNLKRHILRHKSLGNIDKFRFDK